MCPQTFGVGLSEGSTMDGFWGDAARARHPSRHVEEQEVNEIAAQLRGAVCQNLSVADSPSEMVASMRGVIGERLRRDLEA
jgi:cytochrome c-type biogenesis protein CcmH/NrfF